MQREQRVRNFHQAKWDEPCIFELGTEGERGQLLPEVEPDIEAVVGDVFASLPEVLQRKTRAKLPEMAEMQVLRHYLRMSQATLGADLNVDIGQGTCTMKYSPKVNERIVRNHKLMETHPLQDESTVQGTLEAVYGLDEILQEISGMNKFTFQPGGGSQAILTIASLMKAYHEANGEGDQRDEIITTIFSHPSNAAAPKVKGYKVVTLYYDEHGVPDFEALKNAVSERTAGIFITNPEDTGIYNDKIKEFTRVVHEVGGLCAYDQANLNGIMGITRAKEADFDMCFFNLHKTFSAPHGCGGPACGALGVTDVLKPFLPVPLVEKTGSAYTLNYDMPLSIGKIRGFIGVTPVIVKAYAWARSLGAEGLVEAAKVAVLNNNYLLKHIREIPGASAPLSDVKYRIEQVRYSWIDLCEETGVSTHDISLRMADYGFHLWSSHHPFIVPEPFTIEPTESYSKVELDEYLAGLRQVVKECRETPEVVKTAPHNSVIHRVDESVLDDPSKWAITWRLFKKKQGFEL
ncbi:MAG: aminomethyl-transferring glycine dehydrogenase subunit GcvPB [Clostridia bacterium]|nr:aminomethyl-transferring glycine dehydrogenase subunit GcvPB [Clostridia bacterium]